MRFGLLVGLIVMGVTARVTVAQDPLFAEGGARALGMGGAATGLPGVAWGHANAASWSTLDARAFALFASQTFGLAEMRTGAAVYAEPFPWGALAAGARSYGFADYRETHVLLGGARAFALGTTRAFHLGIALRYQHLAISNGYGSAGAIGLSAGWLVDVLPALTIGFQATNVNFPEAGGDDLPRTFALGLSYRPAHNATVVLDALKDVVWPVTVRGGFEIVPVPQLALRAGATLQPARYTLGIGVHLGRLRADVAADRHENAELGWTPAFTLALYW